jgi:hypothetical protein
MDRASGWGSLQARAGRSPGGALEQPSADGWGWRFLALERDFWGGEGMPSEFERFRGSQDVGRRIAAHDLANRGWVAGTSVFPVLMKLAKLMEISRITLDRRDGPGARG